MWLRDQDDKTKKLFSDPSITWKALEEAMKANVAAKNFRMGGYGLSKAGLTALTMIQVKLNIQVKVALAQYKARRKYGFLVKYS